MTDKRDYYDILQIDKNADGNAIKKAYRKLAKKYHPDTNNKNPEAEQRFKEITEAYNILSNSEKKKLYDQFGHIAFEAGFDPEAAKASASGHPGGYREYHFEGGNVDDVFQDIFGNIFHGGSSGEFSYRGPADHGAGFGQNHFRQGDFQQNRFRQGGFGQGSFGQEGHGRKGANLHSEVSVTFDEAVFGCDKMIHFQSAENLPGGSMSLQLHIPAGIETGKSIRLRGKGMPGYHGGEPGDLLLKVTVLGKPGFTRRGMDVYTTVSIPFTTAVLGGEALVQTLYGDVLCTIKEGTQSGSKIRLKGKGIVSMKNPDVHGDHYVTVQIQVPTNLDPQAKQRLKEFALASEHAGRKYRKSGTV